MNIDEAIMYAIKTSHAIKDEKKEQLTDYFCQMQQENKKYKEVINKAIALLEDDNICADIRRNKPIDDNRGLPFPKCIVEYGVEKELLSILKEVEHEKIND